MKISFVLALEQYNWISWSQQRETQVRGRTNLSQMAAASSTFCSHIWWWNKMKISSSYWFKDGLNPASITATASIYGCCSSWHCQQSAMQSCGVWGSCSTAPWSDLWASDSASPLLRDPFGEPFVGFFPSWTTLRCSKLSYKVMLIIQL